MWSTAREIAPGDTVILWLTRDSVQSIVVVPGHDFNGRFGNYRHADLVGVPYGSKVPSRNGRGFIHVLRPTPELWTLALPHRTQILYLADIAFVTARLAIRPGSHVLEAGTGSGSFSHSIARTIGPSGHLYSFEFHQPRADKAREEFLRHGMSNYVSLEHRNVCKDGFGLTDAVDAIFLDLPMPWDAIAQAKEAARKDRIVRICCFSPCIEQVLRTVSALNEHGFTDITMYETLLRPYDILQTPVPVSLKVIRERLQTAEQAKEDRRLQQIATSRARKEAQGLGQDPTLPLPKRKRDPFEDEEQENGKRGRSETPDASLSTTPRPTMIVTQPIKEVRGHTSYLTFACLLPSNVPELSQPQPEPQEQDQPEPEGPVAIPEPPQTDEPDGDQGQTTQTEKP